jgi:hypothetical protein
MSEIITANNIIKGISKKYHLAFCSKFKYYEGNAYNNSKGETIPMYLNYGSRVYKLKYFDGCFNPFLVDITSEIDKRLSDAYSRLFMAKNDEDKNRALKYVESLENIFN